MSLNCLTCQILQRTDSNNDRDHYHCGKEKDSRKMFFKERVGRSWSGISPEAYEQIRSDDPTSVVASREIKKGHRRLKTIGTTYEAVAFEAGDGEPRLMRSSGMRRDWSFEKLSREVQISSTLFPSTN